MPSQQASKPTNQIRTGAYTNRNLDVWQAAQEIAAEIILLLRRLPRDAAIDEITRQLVASAGSVGANIAEGHGWFTFGAYKNHLSIAKGSACETDSWLDLLRRIDAITNEQEIGFHTRISSLIALLTNKIRTLKAQAGGRTRSHISEDMALYDATAISELEQA